MKALGAFGIQAQDAAERGQRKAAFGLIDTEPRFARGAGGVDHRDRVHVALHPERDSGKHPRAGPGALGGKLDVAQQPRPVRIRKLESSRGCLDSHHAEVYGRRNCWHARPL